jgi:murein DD-endopeptidase MepM/ murein hydrolase activator NlpD
LKKNILRILIAIVTLIFIFAIIFSRTIFHVIKNNITPSQIDTLASAPIVARDNTLPVDSFYVIDGKVNQNENLSDIFLRYKIPVNILNEIISKYDSIFDVKKIKAGSTYKMYLSKGKNSVAKYFLYEKSQLESLLFSLSDSVNVIKNNKDIICRKKTVIIKIKTSLWNAIVENKLNIDMTSRLENIFQWTVDFFGLQKGDYFKIIYEEQYVDSQFYSYGKIYGSFFHSGNKEIYAIPFIQNKIEGFFDENGKSLKRVFLKAPLRFSRISSGYSNNRFHPVLKIWRPHHGIDYSAPSGTPVFSVGDGQVTYKGWSGGGGKTIKIRHTGIYNSLYMHLSNYAKGIHQGSNIKQGQIIGYVGMTGLSTGPHLDFRISKNNSYVNPLNIQSPPLEPVKKKNKVDFIVLKNKIVKELNEIR